MTSMKRKRDLKKEEGKQEVASFVKILVEMLDCAVDSVIWWDADGQSFYISNQEVFAKHVLPKYFNHSNWQSFKRQLNNYGFRLTSKKTNWSHSQNLFCKGGHDLMTLISRKGHIVDGDSHIFSVEYKPQMVSPTQAGSSAGPVTVSTDCIYEATRHMCNEIAKMCQSQDLTTQAYPKKIKIEVVWPMAAPSGARTNIPLPPAGPIPGIEMPTSNEHRISTSSPVFPSSFDLDDDSESISDEGSLDGESDQDQEAWASITQKETQIPLPLPPKSDILTSKGHVGLIASSKQEPDFPPPCPLVASKETIVNSPNIGQRHGAIVTSPYVYTASHAGLDNFDFDEACSFFDHMLTEGQLRN